MSVKVNGIGSVGGDIKIKEDRSKRNITVSIGTVVIIAVLAIIYLVVSGGMEKKIVGKWQMTGTDEVYEFTEDGQFLRLTGSSQGVTITYTVNEDRLYLSVSVLWANAIVSADVKISGDTLTLSNFSDPDDIFGAEEGDTWNLTKVK